MIANHLAIDTRNVASKIYATTPERVGKVDLKSIFHAGTGGITDEALHACKVNGINPLELMPPTKESF